MDCDPLHRADHLVSHNEVVQAKVLIADHEFDVAVAVTDRKDMRYHMIVGMDVLRNSRFLVDPSKGNELENGAHPTAHP